MSVSITSSVVALWSICELIFYASEAHNWDDFPLQVTFENGDTQITLDAYWDGGNVWKVRFTPTKTGTWEWKASSRDSKLNGLSGSIDCVEPEEDRIAENPNLRGHLRISPNGRHFTYADGTPFLYLGDTCWSMNEERCGIGENQDGPFYVWMRDRKSKGITVINHWIFKSEHPAVDGRTYSSSNEGGKPFEICENEYVFDRLKPGFFKYVDIRWRALWENGFVMAGPPTWFCKPKYHANLEQAKNISRYIMSRYGAYNLIWALSGEYSFGEQRKHTPWDKVSAWNELGNYIAAHSPYKHPISIHPGPANYHASSSIDFHNSGWLDHNWLQSGQYPKGQHRIALWAREDYDREPVRPVLHGEGFYEGNNAADSFHIRYQPWSAFLNGACGDVYGAHAIWTFNDYDDPRSIRWGKGNRLDWREGLKLPGSGHLKHVADFFNSIEWWKLVPCREWLRIEGNPSPMPTEDDITPPHCASEVGQTYVIYIPQGNRDKIISVTHLEGRAYRARWYDPRNGVYSDINDGKSVNTDQRDEWMLPSVPDDEDWVVILTRIAVDENNEEEASSSIPISELAGSRAQFTFPPKLSADGRYLVDQHEKPFLVIGDSPWSLIAQLTPDQVNRYLDDRQAKGFTLLLVNLIEHKFASDPPRLRDGTPPFHTPDDFATPNDAYFTYAEEVVRKAGKRGLVILLCPAYLGFGGGDQGFYQEMLQSGPAKIREYGRYLGRRFRDHPNLIWIIGGDFNPPPEQRWVANEVAAGIRAEDTTHLMTAHCGPNGVAANTYGDQSWLQLNNVYDYREELYVPCLAEDTRQPRMPYFLLETAYEGEHNATPDRIRRQAYWPLLCGAFGQLYGNSPMWHFGSVGVYDQGGDWVAALDSQGARDMAHLASLFRLLHWWLLQADHEHKVVIAGFGTFGQPDYVTTARTMDGTQAVSYVPSTGTEKRELSVDLAQLAGKITAHWFNPVDGSYIHIPGSPFPNTGIQVFTTPGDNGTGTNDWLLLLEAK